MRVLPCEDEERMVRRPRTWGVASIGEVGPVAGVLGVTVVVIDFGVGNNCVRGGGSRMEFGYFGREAVQVREVLVLSPLEGKGSRGIEVADRGGKTRFQV